MSVKEKFLVLLVAFVAVFGAPQLVFASIEDFKSTVENLSSFQHRYSDSPEIFRAAEYLEGKYVELGVSTQRQNYNPLLTFPFYREATKKSYRSYFAIHRDSFVNDFNAVCLAPVDPELVKKISTRLDRIAKTVADLCGVQAADRFDWYIDNAVDFATARTRRNLETRSMSEWPNVVAFFKTKVAPEVGKTPLCVIGAHFDSIAHGGDRRDSPMPPVLIAPGADDNASGTAALLLLAKKLKNQTSSGQNNWSCDIALVHFSGEEHGYIGSLAFVHLLSYLPPLKLMLNIDMIGYSATKTPKLNIGYDNTLWAKEELLACVPAAVEKANQLRTPLVFVERKTFLYTSDQIPFWNAGVPALSFSEQACATEVCENPYQEFNPNLHSPEDSVDKINFPYAEAALNTLDKLVDGLVTTSCKFR